MIDSFLEQLFHKHVACTICLPNDKVIGFFDDLIGLLFPDSTLRNFESFEEVKYFAKKNQHDSSNILQYNPKNANGTGIQKCIDFFAKVRQIEQVLNEDATAMFNGDPAAKSSQEVIRSYLGFKSITAYRVAHVLYSLGIDLIPRVISEVVHSRTGIDVHSGVQIGRSFCVDHGTGVVIGQTCIIGEHVKIYQGVTLGALSVKKEDAKIKRHPTIEDGVVIYAGATYLEEILL